MVDLAHRQVVHLNDVALELAPGTRLPIGLDDWSDAAQLRDVSGAELSETAHPLSRVARSEPVEGQAVSAARRSALGGGREPLWIVALPMHGAPMLDGHALVVLIPMREAGAVAEAQDVARGDLTPELHSRAVSATAMSFTVADALDPEQPLVWVNPAFSDTTGYDLDDVVGRNCRFLQGPETSPDAPRLMREAIAAGESISVTLLNYRKDGTAFWNQVDLSPVRDTEGVVAHYVGIQSDVTARVLSDRRIQEALAAEREARADAESSRGRLAFLVEAINQLSGTLDEEECADRLLGLVVPHLADWALLVRVGQPTRSAMLAGRHRDPARQVDVDAYLADMPGWLHDGDLAQMLLDGEEVRILDRLGEPESMAARSTYMKDRSMAERTADLDGRTAMVVGLTGRTELHDVLILVRTSGRDEFTDDDVTSALDLGRRAGLVLENVHLYQTQARIAETLQRSLLPQLSGTSRVEACARYVASEDGARIGGDFYELLDLGDDGIGLAIGDVTGHDIMAAATMGHLTGLLRASAHDGHASPAGVLEKVERLMQSLDLETIASAVFAHAAPLPDGGWRMTWSSAGHPPLLVRHPDRTVERLGAPDANDSLLGVGSGQRRDHGVDLPAGAIVIGYTDGLFERRGEVIDEGLDRLARVVAADIDDVGELCEHIVSTLGGNVDDDIALLAVRLP